MAHDVLDTLPFPRGQTAQGTLTLSSPTGDGSRVSQIPATGYLFDADGTSKTQYRSDLAGKIYAVRDTKNGTGRSVLLRAVQIQTAFTVASSGGYGVGTAIQFDTTHGRFGVVQGLGGVGTNAPAAGLVTKPLDDAYAAGTKFVAGDWAYVVEKGPCSVPAGTVTAGLQAKASNDGTFLNGTDGTTCVGTFLTADSSSRAVLDVRGGITADKTGGT